MNQTVDRSGFKELTDAMLVVRQLYMAAVVAREDTLSETEERDLNEMIRELEDRRRVLRSRITASLAQGSSLPVPSDAQVKAVADLSAEVAALTVRAQSASIILTTGAKVLEMARSIQRNQAGDVA